jgi:hypothetical protein
MREQSRFLWVALVLLPLLASCGGGGRKSNPDAQPRTEARGDRRPSKSVQVPPVALIPVDLSDAVHPLALKSGTVELAAARNEFASFVLQIGPRVAAVNYSLRIQAPAGSSVEAYQVLPMPVDVNRAGYARHTGQDATLGDLPRALLPLKTLPDGSFDLHVRDSSRPGDPNAAASANTPALLWVDVHVPADAPAGDYAASCEAIARGKMLATVPLKLSVYDFALPDPRHLEVVGRLDWDDLQRLYPDRFEAIRPHLMNREKPEYADAVRTLDGLMALAHRHRTSVIVPRLHPVVKWPPLGPPVVDWKEFDSLVGKWLTGEAFEDKQPMGFWPLPAPDMLDRYNRKSQLDYWGNAAEHFDQRDWLNRAPVWIEKITPGRATEAESAELSRLAAETLAIHQRVRTAVPLETDQLIITDLGAAAAPDKIDPATTSRMMSAAPGLVFAPPMRIWPDGVERPMHYLRTNMPALLPYIGAGGDERDVRLWAWLAFLRNASVINFSDALPSLSDPTERADPNELIWFYPGEWFGLSEPVPTIQLKWLRRAQQDFEYLRLAYDRAWAAKDRDIYIDTNMMARLITKPVEIQPGQFPDPAYTMMSGTTSQIAWDDAQRLLAKMILLHPSPDVKVDQTAQFAIQNEILLWQQPQERPLLVGRRTQWSFDPEQKDPWLKLDFDVDLYNASAIPQKDNLINWTSVAPTSGWQIETAASPAPALPEYNVRRAGIEGRFDLSKITPAGRAPMEVTFTNGYKRTGASLKVVLPVATSDRREGRLAIDGRLDDDWNEADLVQDGPLVKMLSRPSLQQQRLELAANGSKVYTSWAATNFYVAFDLGGVELGAAGAGVAGQNFVDYQFRRAWGEDLCEILIQPLNDKGAPGPVLHVVCKPNGSSWVERKNGGENPWTEVEARIPYKSRQEAERWRGEISIPWKAILDAAALNGDIEPPALLRFNFVQHRHATAESASWCGPVDFGRDENMMGILYLRDPQEPGPRGKVAGSGRGSADPAER